ncbi:hypothetical protein FOXG_20205 [Fusarium oxysporum f. sp. lycopersici 4287]|uniref:Uncharacterized protein n=2 Tax=Fusarium oxysporum TaxID=5507 RepID=A0A0J9VEH1_FUSO4|nr:hypothetical protein FOXG_20205 [Fusarium oxysporum f. sp. lycopersici 4287]EXK28251.1 hypothetical protein FOMG_15252 [Fusarium oxysporum f. sp. melonis 26406]KNB09443.1 hypothetical protein FOXG_20205 [Fusarium oxysporum f. sp. lycopersici 4287]
MEPSVRIQRGTTGNRIIETPGTVGQWLTLCLI